MEALFVPQRIAQVHDESASVEFSDSDTLHLAEPARLATLNARISLCPHCSIVHRNDGVGDYHTPERCVRIASNINVDEPGSILRRLTNFEMWRDVYKKDHPDYVSRIGHDTMFRMRNISKLYSQEWANRYSATIVDQCVRALIGELTCIQNTAAYMDAAVSSHVLDEWSQNWMAFFVVRRTQRGDKQEKELVGYLLSQLADRASHVALSAFSVNGIYAPGYDIRPTNNVLPKRVNGIRRIWVREDCRNQGIGHWMVKASRNFIDPTECLGPNRDAFYAPLFVHQPYQKSSDVRHFAVSLKKAHHERLGMDPPIETTADHLNVLVYYDRDIPTFDHQPVNKNCSSRSIRHANTNTVPSTRAPGDPGRSSEPRQEHCNNDAQQSGVTGAVPHGPDVGSSSQHAGNPSSFHPQASRVSTENNVRARDGSTQEEPAFRQPPTYIVDHQDRQDSGHEQAGGSQIVSQSLLSAYAQEAQQTGIGLQFSQQVPSNASRVESQSHANSLMTLSKGQSPRQEHAVDSETGQKERTMTPQHLQVPQADMRDPAHPANNISEDPDLIPIPPAERTQGEVDPSSAFGQSQTVLPSGGDDHNVPWPINDFEELGSDPLLTLFPESPEWLLDLHKLMPGSSSEDL